MTKKLAIILALIATTALALVPSAFAKPGELDPEFGSKGIAYSAEAPSREFPGPEAEAARAPDGTLYVLAKGYSTGFPARLLAYGPNGQAETSFGSGGQLEVAHFRGTVFFPVSVAVDGAGRVLVAGVSSVIGGSPIGIERLLPDGSPDPSFGMGGTVEVKPKILVRGSYFDASTSHPTVAVDPVGRILVTMSVDGTCPAGVDIVRLAEDGDPDPTFGQKGVIYLEEATQAFASGGPQWVGGLGGFEVAATAGNAPCIDVKEVSYDYRLLRFGPAGEFDSSFGSGGVAELAPAGPESPVAPPAISLDPQGRTWVVADGRIRRVSPTGAYETTFGTNGTARLPKGDEPKAIVATGGGSALVTGNRSTGIDAETGQPSDPRLVLARFDGHGKLVPGFGKAGVATATVGKRGEALGQGVLLDGAGHAIAVGAVRSPNKPKVESGVGLFQFDLTR